MAFKPVHDGAMVMGDLVLLESEINPVMAKLIEGGIEITAVHNHLLRANPATFYMHVGGHGDPAKMASVIHDALSASKTPLSPPAAAAPPPAIDLDTARLDEVIGVKGQSNGGVYQFGVPRRDPVTENGMSLGPAGPLGLATAINFQPTGSGKAAITGDFVLTGDEVNPVIRALRSNGIEVTAVHSHMLDEQPRLFFLHFWANDDAEKLARGLRAAIDKTASLARTHRAKTRKGRHHESRDRLLAHAVWMAGRAHGSAQAANNCSKDCRRLPTSVSKGSLAGRVQD